MFSSNQNQRYFTGVTYTKTINFYFRQLLPDAYYDEFRLTIVQLRICSCLACVYRVMDAREKFGEHERCVRVARGDRRVPL